MEKRFKESLNTAVLTTKYILENQSPILFVFHYIEDGMWQFSGSENIITDSDFRIVSLEEIITIDDSVLELINLPLGKEAYRLDRHSPWVIK